MNLVAVLFLAFRDNLAQLASRTRTKLDDKLLSLIEKLVRTARGLDPEDKEAVRNMIEKRRRK